MPTPDQNTPKNQPVAPKQPAERAQPLEDTQRQTQGNPEEQQGKPEPREADGD